MITAQRRQNVLSVPISFRWYCMLIVVVEVYGRCAMAKVGLEAVGAFSMVLNIE